jgi:hypothetical protein
MPNWYAYDSAWHDITEPWAYDSAWRQIVEAWSYDSAWRKIFEAVSCATASYTGAGIAWSDTPCTQANECMYCMEFNPVDCTDECHNIDGWVSKNGGSYKLTVSCKNKACANQTATDCNDTFDCDFTAGGAQCYADSDTWQGKLEIQRDADSGIDATYTAPSASTGPCIA